MNYSQSDPVGLAGISRSAATKTHIFVADAGSGHRTTAQALIPYIPEDVRKGVRIVNPHTEVIEPGSKLLDKLVAAYADATYNALLTKFSRPGYWSYPFYTLAIVYQKARRRKIDLLIGDFLDRERPDLVIIAMPLLVNNVVRQANRRSIPTLILMTDLEESLIGTWIPRNPTYFLAFGEQAVRRARAKGARHAWLLSGPVLRPKFFERDRHISKFVGVKLGLDPSKPTVLVCFGGYVSSKLADIATVLDEIDVTFQVLFMCGHNTVVRAKLDELHTTYPKRTFGYISRPDRLMEIADIMIGKPGPGTTFEAIAKDLPLLVEMNAGSLPQELRIGKYVVAKGFGRSYRNDFELQQALRDWLVNWSPESRRRNPPFRSDREVRRILNVVYNQLDSRSCLGVETPTQELARLRAENTALRAERTKLATKRD
jgi:1,2-diacylglycerol 3-beta-galactosyltransferase